MSFRDFNSMPEERPAVLNTQPMGNSSGLGSFHTVNSEDRAPNNTGKIVGAFAVALMLGAGGIYAYTISGKAEQNRTAVADSSLPQPSAPAPVAPQPLPANSVTQTQDNAPTVAPATDTPQPAPIIAPVKSASAKPSAGSASARMAANGNQPAVPAQQTSVIPEPVSPTPSPSDVAANTVPAPQPETATPEVTPVPAPESQAAPAPAQPSTPVQ